MNRYACAAALALSIAGIAAPAPAQTLIGKGDAFLLGGEQRVPMRVIGRNTGRVPVEVMAEARGRRRAIAIVAPGGRFDQIFAAGEIAVLRNTSTVQQASVKIELNKQLFNLSMRYQLPQD